MYTDIPNLIRPLLARVLGLAGEGRKALMLTTQLDGGISTRAYYSHVIRQKKIRAAFREAMVAGEGWGAVYILYILYKTCIHV